MEPKLSGYRITKAFVFDLDPAGCAASAAAVWEYFADKNIDAEIAKYTDSRAFLKYFDDNRNDTVCYDVSHVKGEAVRLILIRVVFICVDSMMAMEVARKIRELDKVTPMFMISSTDDYGLEAYRLKMLNLIIKPLTLESVRESVKRITPAVIEYAGKM